MKTQDLRSLKQADLETKIAELRKELVEKKRALHAGELQNPQNIKEVRRTIATALTLLNQQKSAAADKEEE